MKKVIRLTESDLHKIVRQCINEIGDTQFGQNMLGRLATRQAYRDKDTKKANHTIWYAQDANDDQYQKEIENKKPKIYADRAYDVRDDAFRMGRSDEFAKLNHY